MQPVARSFPFTVHGGFMFEMTRIDDSRKDWLDHLYRELHTMYRSLNEATIGNSCLATSIVQLGFNEQRKTSTPGKYSEVRVATFVDAERNRLPVFDPRRAARVYVFRLDAPACYRANKTVAGVKDAYVIYPFATPAEAQLDLTKHLVEGITNLEMQLTRKRIEMDSIIKSLSRVVSR